MALSTVSITATKSGMATGGSEIVASGSLTNSSASDNHIVYAFTAATFASVAVPAGSTGVYIQPPPSNSGAITLKGATGDTGVALHRANPTFLSLDSGASIGLLCASSISIDFFWT